MSQKQRKTALKKFVNKHGGIKGMYAIGRSFKIAPSTLYQMCYKKAYPVPDYVMELIKT